ncbi:MAG: hypothetical protein WD294_06860 [Phycisphaeraceae bacterium]
MSFEVDPPDLPDILKSTFDELGWARVSFREASDRLVASALLPDGRTARITAEPDPENPHLLIVHAQVGHFGDADHERRFLDALEAER